MSLFLHSLGLPLFFISLIFYRGLIAVQLPSKPSYIDGELMFDSFSEGPDLEISLFFDEISAKGGIEFERLDSFSGDITIAEIFPLDDSIELSIFLFEP